ncbi:MAG TPA: hypothetical protein PKE39_13765 [Ignavibacteria bacterium]|nr:hypothetical protein [Ignavibacteria bacterium]HMR00085.1 hypothetical protein [Ignavibacteria bacterium]
MNAMIPVSPGELLDKITILEIKKKNIKTASKLKLIKTELSHLRKILNEMLSSSKRIKPAVLTEKKKLLAVNKKLWDIENRIRAMEAKQNFDKGFIELARLVYITNDKRSEIKNRINILFGSAIKEVKQYSKY